MAAPVRKDKGDSRERILEGAAEEFATSGFAGARIDRIARRTRLNVRMIYYYFGSKKGLYRGVLESIYEQVARFLDEARSANRTPLAALGSYFDLLISKPRFADVWVREILDGSKHLRPLFKERPELFQRVHYDARSVFAQAVSDGLLAEQDPALAVTSLTSILCFLTTARESFPLFTDGQRLDDASWKAHLFRLLLDGLRRR